MGLLVVFYIWPYFSAFLVFRPYMVSASCDYGLPYRVLVPRPCCQNNDGLYKGCSINYKHEKDCARARMLLQILTES